MSMGGQDRIHGRFPIYGFSGNGRYSEGIVESAAAHHRETDSGTRTGLQRSSFFPSRQWVNAP